MDKQKANFIAAISADLNRGRPDAAEAKSREALKVYPKDFLFLSYLGMAEVQLKKEKDAVGHFRKATRVAPKNFEGWRNLASAEEAIGNIAAAQGALQKALKLNPKFHEGWRALARLYQKWEKNDKAIESFKKALKIKPDFAIAAAELMHLQERTNQIEDLRETLAKINRTAPENAISLLFKGVLHFRDKEYEEARDTLSSFVFPHGNSFDLLPFELKRVRFLARSYDSLNDADNAFQYFTRSKEINRQLHGRQRIDPQKYRDMLADRVDYFSQPVLAPWVPKSEFTDSPVFMVGFPRSGTTLLDTFLRGHKDISVIEEKPLVAAMRQKLGTRDAGISMMEQVSKETLSAARQAYYERMKAEKVSGLVVDKLPFNMNHVGEILRVFPAARFIFVMRDPADAVFSNFMQVFKLNNPMATMETPLSAAQTYDSSMRIWKETVRHLDPARVISRYEDLVADPEKTLKPTIEFLGLPWDPAILDHSGTAKSRSYIKTPSYMQVVQPIYKTALARWERYAHLMPETMEILAPWRKEFGYSD